MRPRLLIAVAGAAYVAGSLISGARASSQVEKGAMARYLVEAKFTDASWAAMAEKPQDRRALLGAVVTKLGGVVDSYWFSLGEYDAVVIVELPSAVDAEALQIAGAAGAGFKALKTTPLLTVEEAMEAMKKAGELRASSQYRAAHDGLSH